MPTLRHRSFCYLWSLHEILPFQNHKIQKQWYPLKLNTRQKCEVCTTTLPMIPHTFKATSVCQPSCTDSCFIFGLCIWCCHFKNVKQKYNDTVVFIPLLVSEVRIPLFMEIVHPLFSILLTPGQPYSVIKVWVVCAVFICVQTIVQLPVPDISNLFT